MAYFTSAAKVFHHKKIIISTRSSLASGSVQEMLVFIFSQIRWRIDSSSETILFDPALTDKPQVEPQIYSACFFRSSGQSYLFYN